MRPTYKLPGEENFHREHAVVRHTETEIWVFLSDGDLQGPHDPVMDIDVYGKYGKSECVLWRGDYHIMVDITPRPEPGRLWCRQILISLAPSDDKKADLDRIKHLDPYGVYKKAQPH